MVSLPTIEEETVEGIKVGRENVDFFQINEVDLQWDSIDRVFDHEFSLVKGRGKIENNRRSSVKRKVEKEARKIIEWEAEECPTTKLLTVCSDRISVNLFSVIDDVNRASY